MFGNEELVGYMEEHVGELKCGMRFYPDIKCVMPKPFENCEQRIRDMRVYEDDVWLLTYPKCGTTWSQEMLWLIMNNLDYKGAEEFLFSRSPFLELSALVASGNILQDALKDTHMSDTLTFTDNLPRPRLIKSHLPISLLPSQLMEKKPKIIFVLRDPKDAAVSYYHHHKILPDGYTGATDKFFEAYLQGLVSYGSYWHFNEQLWKLRKEPNVFYFGFEEMKKDLGSVVRRSAKFLGKAVSEEDMPGLLEHLSFDKMKTNDAVNMKIFHEKRKEIIAEENGPLPPAQPSSGGDFIRKGEVGDHKCLMSPEIIKKFNEVHSRMKHELRMEDFPY